MKISKILTAVGLFSAIVAAASANANVNPPFVNKAFCNISADRLTLFYFDSNGQFATEDDLYFAGGAPELKKTNTTWVFNKVTHEITASYNTPSKGPQESKLKMTSADSLEYDGRVYTPRGCKK